MTDVKRKIAMLVVGLALSFPTSIHSAAAHGRGDLAVFGGTPTSDGVYVLHPRRSEIHKVYDRIPYFRNESTSVAWSPDHTKVAFEAGGEYAENIFVWNRNSRRVRRITSQAGRETHPSWSPDGRRLVYVHEPDSGAADLFVVRADGSRRRPLTRDAASQYTTEWSPDGSRIAYASSSGLFVIRPDGSHRIRLTRRALDQHPAWAPGSQRLVFSRIRVGGRGAFLAVIHRDGSDLRKLTDSRGRDQEPEWAPDGSRIAFAHATRDDQSPRVFVYSVRPSGRGLRRLTRNLADGSSPTGVNPRWSRGSRRIAYLRYHREGDERQPESNIWVMRRDGSRRRNLTPDAGPSGFFGLDW